jgi:hypothetical protein
MSVGREIGVPCALGCARAPPCCRAEAQQETLGRGASRTRPAWPPVSPSATTNRQQVGTQKEAAVHGTGCIGG